MATASVQETLIRKGLLNIFFKLCHLALPPYISLHDLVTPPLGLLSSCFKKKPSARAGGQGGRRGGREAEPIAGLQGAKQSAEPLVSGSLSSAHIRVKSFQLFAKPLVKDNQARCHRANSVYIKAVMKFTAGLPSPSNGPASR